ncbi:hypothetical protein JYB62_14365 [Algoriphagus lutimaris]|uniref:hypothetical protein n=1 Tax=Algoriphagus lutimaris TaxID=613197 RepID=UPI00196AF533|nr:hypothetical protein [Algoriphagus lutimaris]MBN3521191.1 hypothetical protein [Algoriphagus lutimaris]
MKNLFKIMLGIWVLTGVQYQAFSQNVETDPVSKEAISSLQHLIGSWSGSGWMMGADRERYEFTQTEHIQFKLDSTAILIEGQGKTHDQIIHNAMAIVTFGGEKDQYSFQSYLQNGRKGEFKAETINGNFYWYPREDIRYIIRIDEQETWFEIGEIKKGENWYQFFEMTLSKNAQ